MDGTIVDTEPYWIQTEFELAEEFGGTWSQEHALNLVGKALLDSGVYIREVMGIDLTPEEIVERLLDGVVEHVRHKVPWLPGARELILELAEAGVPQALVTMSYQRFVDPILQHLPAGIFAAVVTGDQVDNGKPHPEPYLEAAERLGVSISECVAIEDSPTGVASAVAAGMRVIAIPSHLALPESEDYSTRPSLEGLRASDLLHS